MGSKRLGHSCLTTKTLLLLKVWPVDETGHCEHKLLLSSVVSRVGLAITPPFCQLTRSAHPLAHF